MRLKYNADTQLIFQIGDPIDHLCSTFLHNAMYAYANINAVCLSMKVDRDSLGDFVQAAKTLHIAGFDITMPHKTKIIDYLDECDPASLKFKCVNHVKIQDGRLIGVGLDGVGMGLSIVHAADGPLTGKRVLIIGAGAVAGPIAADLCSRGVRKVTIVNRTVSKAQYIAQTLRELYPVDSEYAPLEEEALDRLAPLTDIVVQCSSMGYAGNEDHPFLDYISLFPKDCIAADVLYPDSSFLRKARECGLKTVDGTGMLYRQQLALMEFRFGIKLGEDAIREAEESVAIAVAMREIREQRMN